ncbi:MAG: protein TolR [Rhodospirillales bacterium]|nr:protein TolR [Rhodospirillales bacterium]
MAAVHIQRKQRHGRRQRSRPMSDINVTPMVDVMLVLLVIFMVTAPLLTAGVQVDLPETSAGAVTGLDEPLAVSVDSQGRIFVQETEVNLDGLAPRLTAIAGTNPDLRIFVRGDKGIDYGRVMSVVAAINAAGYRKVALITERLSPSPSAGSSATKTTETAKTRQ